jgi:hypothetical protein
MKNKKLLLFWTGLMLFSVSYGQKSDFGIWYNISAQKELARKLNLNLGVTLRSSDNACKVNEAFIQGGLAYDLTRHVSISGLYRYTVGMGTDGFYHPINKIFTDLNGSMHIGSFDFWGRFRFQQRFYNYIEKVNNSLDDSHVRYLLSTTYKKTGLPFDPFIYVELFAPINNSCVKMFDKERYSAGVNYRTTKNNIVEAGYILQHDYECRISHLISITYKMHF